MNADRATLPRLVREEEGSALVEFAFLLIPLLVIVLGGLEVAHQSYIRAIAQGALNDAARRAAVQDPEFTASGSTLEERLENTIAAQLNPVAVNGEFEVTQRSYFDFNDVGNPERIMTDNNGNGQYDAADDDCFQDFNRNDTFDLSGGEAGVGGANDVVFYTVEIEMPHLFPVPFLWDSEDTYELTARTAVRNQPYATQPTPPVLCGV